MLQRETLIRHLGQALSERDSEIAVRKVTTRTVSAAINRIKENREALETVRQWLRDVLDGKPADHVTTILQNVEKALGNDDA